VKVAAPGETVTTVVKRSSAFAPGTDWSAHNPLGPPNDPDDVAAAVDFLMSEDTRNISGQILTVAGGLNPSL
jgi:NAD(P)-dependent dehydrogenase (short-subunit alcohol dehydrogenase family)